MSRGAAFEDALTAMVCSLAAETMEDEYLAMVERHKAGKVGKRGIDLMPTLFAELVSAMSNQNRDVLGDLFQSAVSHQERGQFFTPESLTTILAELTVGSPTDSAEQSEITISDPCCGTGRMLLAAAERHPNARLHGVDIDARCAKISAINLGLRQCYGWIVCGNTLTLETRFAYRIAPFFHESPQGLRRGVIREIPADSSLIFPADGEATGKASDLFAAESQSSPEDLPERRHPITEIPRYILALERQFSSRGGEQDKTETATTDSDATLTSDEVSSKTQRELF